MLSHTELLESWEKDCLIDRTNLMGIMFGHPQLHGKYLTHLMTYKMNLRKSVMKYQSVRLLRQRYFNGEMTKEMLDEQGWVQYNIRRPLKSELESLLDASPDLQLLQEKSVYLESLVLSCESILKDISNRYFLFSNLVSYEKFQAGG